MASIFEAPAALIMRVQQYEIEVLVSAHTESNPYEAQERAPLNTGLYCETVLARQAMLQVPNALEDDHWKNNPDIARKMISYLGIPLFWKEKELFGTICVLDRTPRRFSKKYLDLMYEFKKIIESDFLIIQQQKEISSQDKAMKLLLHDLRTHQTELEMRNKLRQSQSMLARTESISHVGSWSWDVATDTVRWSDELFRIVGLNPADGTPSFAEHSGIYHPEDIAELKRVVGLTLSDGAPYEIELRAIRPDGETRVCLATGFLERDAQGNARLFGSLLDITERKRAEQALQQSEEKHRILFECAGDSISVMDTHGKILTINPPTCEMLGYSYDEFIALPLDKIDAKPELLPELIGIVLNRGYNRFDTELLRKDGSTVSVSVDSRLITWDGQPAIMNICRDITNRKLLENELHQAKLAADAANIAKSQFLANMSHELRNPMNGVLGMTQLLEMTELTRKQHEYVDALKLSGNNLLSLINDVLDLSKIEAGKITIEPVEFCLRHCINDVSLMQQSVIFDKGLKLDLDVAEEIPQFMRGDQLRVKQILHNLLGNAVKFTSQGGITISARLLEQQDSSLLVQIAVRDSGIGISPENLDKIFKPFEQENGSTTRNFGGTGLGLTISRRLAELMGGSITVESTPGEGSCFKVTLPFTVVEESSATQVSPQNASVTWDGPPLRILLVEDEQVNINIGTSLLKKLGHEVAVAENGRKCLAALENDRFDMVLMDINMPDMNGEDALRELRGSEQGTPLHQKVIALTAYSLRGDKEHFMEAGFDGYVSKPMAVNELLLEMKRVLG